MKPVLALRHVAHEGLGTIETALRERGVAFTIVDLAEGGGHTFDPEAWAGLIVMGGPMNVDQTDRYPHLADEVRWIERAVEVDLPTLGVCLGSQLMAKALGSRVYANRAKEIGWYEVEWLSAAEDDVILRASGKTSTVFQWHGDTFDLPAGAVQLARSGECENQAFRFGQAAWGLQFHLEVTQGIIDEWLCESGNCGELAGLDYIDPAKIRRETPKKLPGMTAEGGRVFDRFAELCLWRAMEAKAE